jgi:hypothetical protein
MIPCGSIPASIDTVEFEGAADEAVLNLVHKKNLSGNYIPCMWEIHVINKLLTICIVQ